MDNKHSIENFQLIPGRVEAALRYSRHCQELTDPTSCFGSDKQPGRTLAPQEQAAYLAALDALRLYLTAEMDFGGPPTRIPEPDEGDEAPKRKGNRIGKGLKQRKD